ncbi:NAD(P)-binding domain-containing protein [Actinomadura luteofluorescens]|uniref:NAD(P)-binding domain-containing protein n=1 Tax=Actinomadura luteofluorescens TaxID=46163 RepID=UPI00363128E5
MLTTAPLVVIGGGQAGLATAHIARSLGLAPIVLEAAKRLAGSWPHYYDSLTLFSPARRSALPGTVFPGDPDGYPARDEVVAYLTDYAARLDADIRTGHRVTEVMAAQDGSRGGFEVVTAGGEVLAAPVLIAATGGFSRPHRPDLPGLDGFPGMVLHSSDYRRPDAFAGSARGGRGRGTRRCRSRSSSPGSPTSRWRPGIPCASWRSAFWASTCTSGCSAPGWTPRAGRARC